MNRGTIWLLALVGAALVAWSALRERAVEVEPIEAPPRVAAPAPEGGPRLEGRLAPKVPPYRKDPLVTYHEVSFRTSPRRAATIPPVPTEVGRLSGTVYRADGSVVAGASVQVFREPVHNERSTWRGSSWGREPLNEPARTDANGVFVLEGIPSGVDLRIEVRPQEGRHWSGVQRRSDELMRITLPHDEPLAGRVIDVVTRRPIQHAQVHVASSSHGDTTTQDDIADEAGEFQVLVPSDATCMLHAVSYALRNDTLGLNVREAPEGLDVLDTTSASPGSTSVELRLWRGYEITGHVKGWDGTKQFAPLHIQVYARTREGELDQRRRADLDVSPDGSFLIDVLPPGRFDLVFVPPEGATVAGQIVTTTWVSNVAAPADGLEIELREGAVLRGRIEDLEGRPVAVGGGYVYVRDQDDVASGVGGVFATLDGHGGFATPALAADRAYVVLAGGFADFARTEVRDVRPGETRLMVRMRPSRSLRGVVLNGEGKPVGGRVPVTAWIQGREKSEESSRAWAHTDDTGQFVIESLTADVYELAAGGCGSAFAPSEPLHDVPAGSTGLVLRAVPGANLGGRLVDPRGAGVQALTLIASGTEAPGPCASSTRVDSPLGSFLLTGLPRGRARLSLVRDGKSVDLGEVDVPGDKVRITVPDP